MKNHRILKAAVAAAAFVTGLASAGTVETEISHNIAPLLNNMPIEKIVRSDRAGLYEVITPGGIVYTDKTGSFALFNGAMIDTKTKENLTERRMDELVKFDFSEFPLKDAIKTVRGNGARVMVTFEDPNCGFCKTLMSEVNKIDNVTVYTFLIPILSPDSATKAKAIWCAADPSKTWNDYMGKNIPIPMQASSSCETPLDRNLALSRKLHVMGTPAIYFKNAPKAKGLITADAIELKLK
jgi:thiol:disulfide interchange protein DsbC